MPRLVTVSLFSSANMINVRGFADEIGRRFLGSKIREVRFVHLPYNDVDNVFIHEMDVDAMIVCHSIHNRRFAITDVEGALYNRFLPNAATVQSPDRIGIIVHDMPPEKITTPETITSEVENFSRLQPTTFKCTSMQTIAGKLSGDEPEVELTEDQWTEIERLIDRVALMPKRQPFANKIPKAKVTRKELIEVCGILVAIAIIFGLICGLSTTPKPPPTKSSGSTVASNFTEMSGSLRSKREVELISNNGHWERTDTKRIPRLLGDHRNTTSPKYIKRRSGSRTKTQG